MPDLRVLLALALVGIYLVDSLHLLSIGDAVLVTRQGRLKYVSFGWPFELAGRRPYLPNPFTPFRPPLRIQWTSTADEGRKTAPGAATIEMRSLLELTRPISALGSLAGFSIVLVAPALLAAGEELLFVAAAGVALLFALAACGILIARRKSLALGGFQVLSMSLVAVLCLPCAANLGRAIARHRSWTLTVSDIPALGFDTPNGEHNQRRVAGFLAQVRRLFPEDTSEYRALSDQLLRLEKSGPPHA